MISSAERVSRSGRRATRRLIARISARRRFRVRTGLAQSPQALFKRLVNDARHRPSGLLFERAREANEHLLS